MKKLILAMSLVLMVSALAGATEILITIPDAKTQEIVDAFASAYKYQEKINGQPNTETRDDFMYRKIYEQIEAVYAAYKADEVESGKNAAVDAAKEFVADITVESLAVLE